jgi:hypothetical protein
MNRSLLALAAAVSVLATAQVAAAAQACGVTPVLLVVQDRSGSMNDPPDASSTTSKWSTAASSVPAVLSSYQSGFDFGLMMFPKTTGVCDTGVTTLGVGSTPAQIQASYQASHPGGATPTALTLLAARDYLNSLNLTVPAYVLLITDGEPNCNGGLNGNTCACTQSSRGCVPGTGGTAYNCLDDNRTEDAAAQVRAAGYPVYVVGFGSSSTANNNAAVLNAIASQGGTNSAYSALDQAALNSALNQIVGGVTGCCTSTCTPGNLQCAASGAQQKCEVQASGCYDWSTYPCASGSVCQGGTCQACTGTCAAGTSQCVGNATQTCVADANGCTAWSATTSCSSGELCTAGSSSAACTSCTGTCVAGARQCASTGVAQACVADANGCTAWQDQACASGTTCSGGTCAGCNACTAGATQCAGNVATTCVQDAQGCTAWQSTSPCGATQVCANGTCLDCSSACTTGATRCQSGGTETCQAQLNACNAWVSTGACSDGCAAGACCTNACTPGAVRCGADGSIQTCDASSGCGAWTSTACAAGTACSQGTCKTPCNADVNNCPSGQVCVTTPDGHFCQPGGGSSGSSGSISSSSSGSTSGSTGHSSATTGGSGSTGMTGVTTGGSNGAGAGAGGSSGHPVDRGTGESTKPGCGCNAFPVGELGLGLPFALLLIARRKRSASSKV